MLGPTQLPRNVDIPFLSLQNPIKKFCSLALVPHRPALGDMASHSFTTYQHCPRKTHRLSATLKLNQIKIRLHYTLPQIPPADHEGAARLLGCAPESR